MFSALTLDIEIFYPQGIEKSENSFSFHPNQRNVMSVIVKIINFDVTSYDVWKLVFDICSPNC